MTINSQKKISGNDQLENENIEIKLLLDAINLKYGYDFANYAGASIKRRIKHRLALSGLDCISAMLSKVIYDPAFFETLLSDFSINVTEMFRDPLFYLELKKNVLPELNKKDFIKIWLAGCSTGEEVYSIAIMLKEMEMYNKTRIYATDISDIVLKKAQAGIFPVDAMKTYEANYKTAGGTKSLSNYYIAKYGSVLMDKTLKKNIMFADHNLVTDWIIGEMNLIFCRNVFIYFNRTLQDRVLNLFKESLVEGGFLCLGAKENIRFSAYAEYFEVASEHWRIYKRKIL